MPRPTRRQPGWCARASRQRAWMAAMEDREVYDPQAALTPIEEPQRRRSTLLTGEGRVGLSFGGSGTGRLLPAEGWIACALASARACRQPSECGGTAGGTGGRCGTGDASVQALRCHLLHPSMLGHAEHVCRHCSLPLHPGQRVLRAAGVLRVRCVTQSPSVLPLLSARGAADCSCCLQNRAACGAQCSRGSHRMAPHRVLQRQPGRSLLHEGT